MITKLRSDDLRTIIYGAAIACCFFGCFFAFSFGWLADSAREMWKQKETIAKTQKPVQDLQTLIESMPDGALKGNLYIILATEHLGESKALHALLSAYAKMQLEKLERQKKGDTI